MNHESNNAHNTSPEWKLQFHCPDCGGVLLPVEEGEYVYFRCEVGHQYSPQTLLSDQRTEIESALWAAIRALGERSRLLEEMALKARRNGHMGSAGRFEQRQIELQEQTASIHKVLKMINADSDPGKSSG